MRFTRCAGSRQYADACERGSYARTITSSRGSVAGVAPAVAVAAATLMPRPKHNRTTVARNQSKNQRVKLVSISFSLDRLVPYLTSRSGRRAASGISGRSVGAVTGATEDRSLHGAGDSLHH